MPARQAVQMARNLLLQWRATRKQPQITEQQRNDQLYVQWQPPTEGYVKCNIDAALFGDQQCFGIGMCIRNTQGRFVKALTKWFECYPSPLEVISWLGELGLSMVQIELDCKLVVEGIMDKSNNQSDFGNILSSCRSLLQQFPNFKISFIWRQANFVTHTFSRESRLYASHHVFYLIPSCISSIMLNERI